MQYHMLILQFQVSNNYWKVDYGKQKRTISIHADAQEAFLKINTDTATSRAKELRELQNPSTSVYKLIKLLKGDESKPDI